MASHQHWGNDKELDDVYHLFALKEAHYLSIKTLTEYMKEDGRKYWVYGKIVRLETGNQFWYLSCLWCAREVEVVNGQKICFHCGYNTRDNMYKLEVIVVDDTGSMKLTLSDGASTRLIGQETEDVIALQGFSVKRLPNYIEEEIVGRHALFEVINTEQNSVLRRYNASRLNVDVDVLYEFRHKYLHEEVVDANQLQEEEEEEEEEWWEDDWEEEVEEGSGESGVEDE
ncbi:hypothetical protein CASFOL_016863 [Castilleja foliolosa]|uniref:Replication factor A C-terminal domain-containing protein n=1 Tax=Castilleja foliolosa TaxID=1961234 RepID=A0ABD3DBI9_9LAMI